MIKPKSKVKLTLWMSKEDVEFGRHYTQRRRESLSGLFTLLLQRLKINKKDDRSIPEIIQEITAVIPRAKVSSAAYKKHLKEKYL